MQNMIQSFQKITMKHSALAIFVLGILGISACSKKDNNTASRTELITSATWKFQKAGFDVNGDGFIDADLPPGSLLDCQKDNTISFAANGTGTVDEGATKCEPSDPQSTAITWSFRNNETVINFPTAVFSNLDGDVKIVTLTSTKLSLSKTITLGGTSTADVVVELGH